MKLKTPIYLIAKISLKYQHHVFTITIKLFYMKCKCDTMEVSDEILIEIAYVQISKHRTEVMKYLNGKLKMPSQIANDVDVVQNHISQTLRHLREHGLVECVNPQAKKGRLYRLTEKGKIVSDNLTLLD